MLTQFCSPFDCFLRLWQWVELAPSSESWLQGRLSDPHNLHVCHYWCPFKKLELCVFLMHHFVFFCFHSSGIQKVLAPQIVLCQQYKCPLFFLNTKEHLAAAQLHHWIILTHPQLSLSLTLLFCGSDSLRWVEWLLASACWDWTSFLPQIRMFEVNFEQLSVLYILLQSSQKPLPCGTIL